MRLAYSSGDHYSCTINYFLKENDAKILDRILYSKQVYVSYDTQNESTM